MSISDTSVLALFRYVFIRKPSSFEISKVGIYILPPAPESIMKMFSTFSSLLSITINALAPISWACLALTTKGHSPLSTISIRVY